MKLRSLLTVGIAAVLGVSGIVAFGPTSAMAAEAGDDVALYDTTFDPKPPSTPSLAFETQQIHEYGSVVVLDGSLRELDRVEIGFVSWACEQGYYHLSANPCVTTPGTGFNHPITANLYEEGVGGAVGNLIATVTKNVFVPYRPSATPDDCSIQGDYLDEVLGECFPGLLFVEAFDFSALDVTLPDRLIVTATFNTSTTGNTPIGPVQPGEEDGFNVLNMAISGATPAHVGTAEESFYMNASASWLDTQGELAGPITGWGSAYLPQIALYSKVPPKPSPVVSTTAWVDSTIGECAESVEQTREVTTTGHIWDEGGQAWVLDPETAVVTTEVRERTLTPEEVQAACPQPAPSVPDELAATGVQSFDLALIFGSALILLGAGAILGRSVLSASKSRR